MMNEFARWFGTMTARGRVGICVVGLSLTVLLLFVSGVPLLTDSTTGSSDDELALSCQALQHELNQEWLRRHVAVLVHDVRVEEPRDPTRLISELKRQLGRRTVTTQSNQPNDVRQLAEATLALAEHRYQAALPITRELESNSSEQVADPDFIHRVHRLQGDALFGLGQWEGALACYKDSGDGLLVSTKVCVCLTHLVELEGRTDLANERAAGLNQLGLQLDTQGWTRDAIAVFKKAIALRTVLAEEDPQPESSIQLAGTLNNYGLALWHAGQPERAIVQFDRAIVLQTKISEDDEHGLASRHLADTLCNRSCAFLNVGESARALADLDQSVVILEELVEKEGATLVPNLVSALNNRAMTRHQMGLHAIAIEDLNTAIANMTPAASRAGLPPEPELMVHSLTNRATVHRTIGSHDQAIDDLDQAIAIALKLEAEQGRDRMLGICYAERGAAWRDVGKLSTAITDLEQAVSRFELSSRQFPGQTVPAQLAEVFNILARIHSHDCQPISCRD